MEDDQSHIMNRYEHVRHVVSQLAVRADTLLDVGCRDGVLKKYVESLVGYCGLDLCCEGADGRLNCLGNLEQGLPFKNGSYDFVVALDCLEHLNDLQAGAEELLRETAGDAEPKMRELEARIREHPWAAVGIAAGIGLIAGILLSRK